MGRTGARRCRCIVLTGAGERAFTVGAESAATSRQARDRADGQPRIAEKRSLSQADHRRGKRDCVGGGVELMLSTDIRAAAPTARFGLTEVKWSIYPFGGSTIKLIQQIGYVHAMDLLLTAELIDAAEAARLGLVNRLVPPGG